MDAKNDLYKSPMISLRSLSASLAQVGRHPPLLATVDDTALFLDFCWARGMILKAINSVWRSLGALNKSVYLLGPCYLMQTRPQLEFSVPRGVARLEALRVLQLAT